MESRSWLTKQASRIGSATTPLSPIHSTRKRRWTTWSRCALIGDARVVAIGESAHDVREFYLLRHRLLRFLAERCGFSVYAPEAPFTEARAIDAWIQGGPGTVAEVAAAGVAIDLGRCSARHDLLTALEESFGIRPIPLILI